MKGKSMPTISIENIARICHEANRFYCRAIGDSSQVSWDEAPEWQKTSAIAGVHSHLDNPNSLPCDSHNSWLKQKEADGWKYGPIKDAIKKEHPCFLPYDQLPPEQQTKDVLFISIVRALNNATH